MRRRVAVVAAGAALSIGLLAAPLAHADEPACPEGTLVGVRLHLNVNGTDQAQDVCLPPAGTPAPPALPALPAPPVG